VFITSISIIIIVIIIIIIVIVIVIFIIIIVVTVTLSSPSNCHHHHRIVISSMFLQDLDAKCPSGPPKHLANCCGDLRIKACAAQPLSFGSGEANKSKPHWGSW
jgi:hypothetical protein